MYLFLKFRLVACMKNIYIHVYQVRLAVVTPVQHILLYNTVSFIELYTLSKILHITLMCIKKNSVV